MPGSHQGEPIQSPANSVPGALSFKCHFETVLQNFSGYSPVSLSLAPPCTLRFPARSTYLRTTPAEDRPSFSFLLLVSFLNSLEIHGLSQCPRQGTSKDYRPWEHLVSSGTTWLKSSRLMCEKFVNEFLNVVRLPCAQRWWP